MRVETLQLAEAILLSIESGHFQYPPCGSRRCNERDGERQEVENDFQYPPCGSRRCNDIAEAILLSVKQLSVPSMRVETLQRCRQLWWRAPAETFSTLHAGRDAATLWNVGAARASGSFSTLHAGRDAATWISARPKHCSSAFSTLHADRDAATMEQAQVTMETLIFQYPPCGSRRCNLCGWSPVLPGTCTFSTLHAGRDAATSM